MIFTNSTDQLRAALDRSVDKEMAIEAVGESRNMNNSVEAEDKQRGLSPAYDLDISISSENDSSAEQTIVEESAPELSL